MAVQYVCQCNPGFQGDGKHGRRQYQSSIYLSICMACWLDIVLYHSLSQWLWVHSVSVIPLTFMTCAARLVNANQSSMEGGKRCRGHCLNGLSTRQCNTDSRHCTSVIVNQSSMWPLRKPCRVVVGTTPLRLSFSSSSSSSFKCWCGRVRFGDGCSWWTGQWSEVPPWIPTACPGSQHQMATAVFFRVPCGLGSFAKCVLGLGRQFNMATHSCETARGSTCGREVSFRCGFQSVSFYKYYLKEGCSLAVDQTG